MVDDRILRLRKAAKAHEATKLLEGRVSRFIDERDEFGRSALHLAASGGKNVMVQLLIAKGANIHASTK